MLGSNILYFILSFIVIWLGAGLIVSAADKFSHKLRVSSFSISFLILGMLTSTPEIAVGLTAVSEKRPEIFVGNLIGGIPVIFLCILPLLAIIGNGVRMNGQISSGTLLFSIFVFIAPAFFVTDRVVTPFEGGMLILLYIILTFLIQMRKGLFDGKHNQIFHLKSYSIFDLLKILVGIGLVLVSSQIIVDKTLYFSQVLNVTPFYISLIVLSLGTNLPELSVGIRSVLSGKKDIAFGDYIGSAAANTFLFGVFTLMSQGEVITTDNFMRTFLTMAGGLLLLFYFSQSGKMISRREGCILLFIYGVIVLTEYMH